MTSACAAHWVQTASEDLQAACGLKPRHTGHKEMCQVMVVMSFGFLGV